MMSCLPVDRESETGEVCANCGRHGSDTVKLKNCTACRLVKYCGVDCQRAHRKQHKKACKQRAAELKDEQLYSQGLEVRSAPGRLPHPERDIIMKICGACERQLPDDAFSVEQRGLRQRIRRCIACVAAGNELVLMKRGTTRDEDDVCSVCQLPLPIPMEESLLQPCCMKRVCNGCILYGRKCGMCNCPFCRTDVPTKESQVLAMVQKRVAVGDPVAICFLGAHHERGTYGLEKDTKRTDELCQQAAQLGVKEAHFILGNLHGCGEGGSIRHYEEAAMCGHLLSRFNLGVWEYNGGRGHLALQHFLISAKLGHTASLDAVKRLLAEGIATEADYAGALQGYEAAIGEMSSPSRDEAKAMGIEKLVRYNTGPRRPGY
ncbi:hypothetical protein THAOC_37644 [Thalassiosira oceanica]|uniref:MYND-type domain-containing protein n=1 Tax=Thalassiosira oceanica TaxID=159749 RepID=K0QZS2_THAOC|nr:hypothetical protein THAOC_37644 [Thalassiosira oceanica]|eukprot:EJK43869.1 hypothetical protein THAOC_37644 [Thalassiosira oceanica]